MERTQTVDMIDIDQYPVHDPGLAAYAAMLDAGAAEWDAQGFVVLEGFVRARALPGLAAQCDRLAPLGDRVQHSDGGGRSSALVVGYDVFPLASPLRQLYEWDGVLHLVAGIVGEPVLFRSADPLGALELIVMTAGDELGWTTEPSDVVVTVVIRAADSGGARELRPEAGPRGATVAPHVPAGSLMIARGRSGSSRVTPVTGPGARHELRMALASAPGATFGDGAALVRHGRLAGPGRRG